MNKTRNFEIIELAYWQTGLVTGRLYLGAVSSRSIFAQVVELFEDFVSIEKKNRVLFFGGSLEWAEYR